MSSKRARGGGDVSTVNDLTPQELQIALSLAEGRTASESAVHRKLPPRIAGRATGLIGLQQLGQQGCGARQ